MSMLTAAKAKATKGSVAEAFKNEDGAIDLASIMVGIIVIGLIAGVIAATVFAVIPWAQDNAAKQQLESVVQAQNAYTGLNNGSTGSPVGTGSANSYGSAANLEAQGLFVAPESVKIANNGDAAGGAGAYAATSESASGKSFWITNENTQPTEAATQAAAETAAGTEAGVTFA